MKIELTLTQAEVLVNVARLHANILREKSEHEHYRNLARAYLELASKIERQLPREVKPVALVK